MRYWRCPRRVSGPELAHSCGGGAHLNRREGGNSGIAGAGAAGARCGDEYADGVNGPESRVAVDVPLGPATGPAGHPEAEDLAETFRVLADPGRVRVIFVLLKVGEMHVGGLAAAAGLSETACSHALRLLRQGHVVKRRKLGRSVLYSLDDEHIRGLLELARAHVKHAQSGR